MKDLIRAYSVDDVVHRWDEEENKEKLRVILLNAIYAGELSVTDPITDMACLDSDADRDNFLARHEEYQVCYLASGVATIFHQEYFQAIFEFVNYGRVSNKLHGALDCLCLKREDFLKWLTIHDQRLPEFWFTPKEILKNPTAKERALRESTRILDNPEFQRVVQKRLEEIEAIKGIPFLLHDWFKHDNWARVEGLMLLAGLSPETLFVYEQSVFGEPIRQVRYLETLDGLEGNPAGGSRYEYALKSYERLWNSGDHPSKAPPKYFLDWAISKKMPPTWLQWAVEKGYYKYDIINPLPKKEITGKSETAYLHIIGALCDLYWHAIKPGHAKINQAEIISALEVYAGFSGLGERNLKEKISKGIKAIRNE